MRAQEALELRARQDILTGLANREEAFERLAGILGRSKRTGHEIAVLFCDFDDFKTVNDTFGHAGGDELLRVVSDRIRMAVRGGRPRRPNRRRRAARRARRGPRHRRGQRDRREAPLVVLLAVEVSDGTVSTTMSMA